MLAGDSVSNGMFAQAKLLGTPRRSIRLDTKLGNAVENEQALPPDDYTIARMQQQERRFPGWVKRREICGLYNCFGMVWASRRTAIYDEEYSKFLEDDGYREIALQDVMAGDIVTYSWLNDPDRVAHVALVLMVNEDSTGRLRTPYVLSKWNDCSGEFVHNYQDFHQPIDKVSVRFLRENCE